MALYFLHWKSKIEILLEDVQKLNVGEFDKCKIYMFLFLLHYVFLMYFKLI